MSNDQKVFIYSPELELGGYPADCPFNSKRAGKTLETIKANGMIHSEDRSVRPAEPLERGLLERFHTVAYLDALREAGLGTLSPREALNYGLGTPDTPLFRGMHEFTALAAGGTVTAARLIREGQAHIAFNPSGGFHHSHPDRAAGFCFLNDVVLGIETLLEKVRKVMFVDIDAHHCDGVQDAFYLRNDVLTVSLHESGHTLFPGTGFESETGRNEGRGYTVNVPLPVGTYDAIYEWAFQEIVPPLIRAYAPEVIVVEIGMDALAGDPLAHLHLTNNSHASILDQLVRTGIPLLATGGGGYHFDNTVRGWALSWSVLCGDQSAHDDMMLGMGGVMLETTDWAGGLRDRTLLSDAGRRPEIDTEVRRVVDSLKETVFPLHGL
ncbi:MAG: acetoin utilization protein AcuC [Verrucomicrobia bacterium]|nr:acetoin utilization protein AcuC [Verrucomicrobiota bacterium]